MNEKRKGVSRIKSWLTKKRRRSGEDDWGNIVITIWTKLIASAFGKAEEMRTKFAIEDGEFQASQNID